MISHSTSISVPRPRAFSARGFSLAEVTLALAIAAGGFVSLLGLMPHGLEMSRRSADMAAKTRIVEIMSAELAVTSWQSINWTGHGNDTGMRRYFDDQGIELPADSLGSGAMISYVASIFVPPASGGSTTVKLPVTGNGSQGEKYLKRVLVFIASTGDKSFAFPGPEALPRNVTYQTLILPEMGLPQT